MSLFFSFSLSQMKAEVQLFGANKKSGGKSEKILRAALTTLVEI